jgi:glutaredoxin 3
MRKITVYTRQLCGFCTRATRVLAEAGYAFEEIAADGNPALRAELLKRSGQSTLPQIFVGEESVGGYRELANAMSDGRFAQLIERD